jgi:hypothetical protein
MLSYPMKRLVKVSYLDNKRGGQEHEFTHLRGVILEKGRSEVANRSQIIKNAGMG